MKVTIETDSHDFDSAGEPMPAVKALLLKLLGKPILPERELPSLPSTSPPAETSSSPKQTRKSPSLTPKDIPCPGECGRIVKYCGNGPRPSCPSCGGKALVVQDIKNPPPKDPETAEAIIAKELHLPPVETSNQKKCPDCGFSLIVRNQKWYCPNESLYKEVKF